MGTRRGAVSLLVNELIRGRRRLRRGHRRGEARPQADVSLHRFAPTLRGGGRHPADPHLHHGDRPGRPPARQRHQLPDRARSETVRRRPRETREGDSWPSTRTSAAARASVWSCPAWSSPKPAWCSSRRIWAGAISVCAIRSRPVSRCRCRSKTPARPARWRSSGPAASAKAPSNFVYLTVSDGLGVGIVQGGEVVRGQHNIAGEFGHVPLNIDGPALRVRRDRMLGSVRLQPGHALPVLRARSARAAGSVRRRRADGRRPHRPRPRRRRQGAGRAAVDRRGTSVSGSARS